MSKRKISKNTRKNHPAVKAQLATQAVVRSRTNKRPGATELEPSRESNSPQVSIPEDPATALQSQGNQILANFPSMMGNVQVYQAKLLEIAQSDLQLAFEFAHRLLTLRTPAAFVGLVAEFTSKRTDMFWKYSKEMAELGPGRQR
jgi:Phasin protein